MHLPVISSAAFERIERGPHNFLGRTLRGVDIACKVGVDETCMKNGGGAILNMLSVVQARWTVWGLRPMALRNQPHGC
jgi:hypothetical protein